MSDKKQKPVGPYLGLTAIVVILGLFLHTNAKEETKHLVIHYSVSGSDSTMYEVQEGSVTRIGKCLSFTEKEGEEMSFCERYKEMKQ